MDIPFRWDSETSSEGGMSNRCPTSHQGHIRVTFCNIGVGSGGARGAAAPLNAGRRGLHPPTNLRQWVSETRCEIKLPVVIHSGMAQKRIESLPRLRGEQQL